MTTKRELPQAMTDREKFEAYLSRWYPAADLELDEFNCYAENKWRFMFEGYLAGIAAEREGEAK
jgi:hypothetical protein